MKTKLSQRAQQLIARTNPEQTYLRALLVFAAKNPGFEWGNYVTGNYTESRRAYLGDSRPVQKQLRDIRAMSHSFPCLTNETMKQASQIAYSGRLQFTEKDGGVYVDYCTGQYWPTEYRQASLAVLRKAFDIHFGPNN